MDVPSRPSVPATTGASLTDSEEGRAFFQARLSILGLCMAALDGGFWVVSTAVHLVLLGPSVDFWGEDGPLALAGQFQLAGAGLAAALWLVTRGRPLPAAWLPRLDMVGTFAITTLFSLMGAAILEPRNGTMIILMSVLCTVVTRGIVVPSSARRTLAISIAAFLPAISMTVATFAVAGITGPILILVGVYAAEWGAVGTAIATVASRTIFGLRRQVGAIQVLGQYTLEEKIGEGGMGEVWRARHAMLRRPTAIKLLPATLAGAQAIERFEREVQLTARLTHPNTVAIFDYGRTPEGVFYYAMEYLDGLDLDRVVAADGPQPPERVIHVLRQVCGSLAEAHAAGLVHRDIKPANILLSTRGGEADFAKVLDFGLVKPIDANASSPALTSADTITGTPLYMAPEAILGTESLDGRSDLYAVGAVGFFLLTGTPPFQAQTVVEVCSKHLYAAPERPSERLGRPVPRDLEDVLLACLAKTPAERPADAKTLAKALDACAAAGQWTTDRAAAWWSSHRERPAPARPVKASGQRTMAIDVTARGRAA